MSFLSRETSVDAGKPVELYRITNGFKRWYFTSGRKPVTFALDVYEPIPIKRSKIESAREYNKSILSVEVPGTLEMAQDFLRNPPEGHVLLTVFRTHDGDGETAVYWSGRITGVSFAGPQATLRAEPVYTSLRSQGRRKTYSTQCNWTLYRFGCNVNDEAFRTAGSLASVSGIILSSSSFAEQVDGYFEGGKVVVWVDDQPHNRRVASHVGSVINMDTPVTGLLAGGDVSAYPGCDHTLATCIDRFDNSINYGGCPWKPLKDPFSGGSPF